MNLIQIASIAAASKGKDTGFVSILQHCDLQDIFEPLAVYHEDQYETAPAIRSVLKDFFGNDRALPHWRIVATIEL